MRLLITLLFLVYFSGGFSQSVDIDNPVRFLALGDSYTIGQSVPVADRWPEQFAEELRKKDYDVAALKIIAQTGWRTDNLIYAIETERPLIGYNLVSLLIGVNNQYQGASINTYEDEFEELLKTAISLAGDNKESVFVLSIPDYGYTPFGESNQLSISTEINAFNNVNKRITDWYGVAYFDITSISRQGLINTSLVASDGLHPSGEMYARWVELIARNIKRNQGLSTSTVARGTEMNLIVYPNPASERIIVKTQQNASRFILYDVLGKIALEKIIDIESNQIDVSNLSPGIYYYNLYNTDGETLTGKVIIDR